MIEDETYQWPNSSFPTKLRPHMMSHQELMFITEAIPHFQV